MYRLCIIMNVYLGDQRYFVDGDEWDSGFFLIKGNFITERKTRRVTKEGVLVRDRYSC